MHGNLGSSEVFIACSETQRGAVLSLRAIKEIHITLKSTTVAINMKNIACNSCISPQLIFGLINKRSVLQRALFGTIIMSYIGFSSRARERWNKKIMFLPDVLFGASWVWVYWYLLLYGLLCTLLYNPSRPNFSNGKLVNNWIDLWIIQINSWIGVSLIEVQWKFIYSGECSWSMKKLLNGL